MDDPECILRSICCTCLSVDRKLTQLCRVDNGVNNLFFLLSYDSEAYAAMFQKPATQLYICWECKALMSRMCRFRNQACVAQKQLTDITDGKLDIKHTLSNLSFHRQTTYDQVISIDPDTWIENIPYNFVDCGTEMNDIKTEFDINEPLLELPLIETNIDHNDETIDDSQIKIETKQNIKVKKENTGKNERVMTKRKLSTKVDSSDEDVNYSTLEISEEGMLANRETLKCSDSFMNAEHKCDSCIEVFKDSSEMERHNSELHVQKPRHVQCDICLVYIKFWWLPEHKKDHYTRYKCNLCEHTTPDMLDVLKHLKTVHGSNNVRSREWQKVQRRAVQTNPALKSRRIKKPEVKTPFGYLCSECDKYFENKYLRYKHILKFHREGFKCKTCGKTFAFKNTLNKHELTHAPPARVPCRVCARAVRADRAPAHARLHGARERRHCGACDKSFVSRESYEQHLRTSRAHAVRDVHRYKCSTCAKGFRTQTALTDHVNYAHLARTLHKCPECDKALATRRGVTRHVLRAHQGLKEKLGDKILCQTCGKAFRDKKCLREHELIHSGEKPLACDECGRAFRHGASLYSHKRRVHKMAPKRRAVHAPGGDQ